MLSSPYLAKPWLKHYDFWVPPVLNYPRRPVYYMLQIAASQYTDRPAFHFFGNELSFWEIKQRVDRLATALHRLGIRKGDRVGILLQNCPQYSISFFAILRLGAIVTNINPAYTAHEIGRVAADSGMRAVITQDTLVDPVQSIQRQSKIEFVIATHVYEYSTDPQTPQVRPNVLPFAELIAQVDVPELPDADIDPEHDVAVLQYTGGTTGTPKGAMLTHFNLFANVIQISVLGQYFNPRGEGKILFVLPYFHVYGLVVGQLLSFWQGWMQIPIPKYDVNLIIDSIRRHRPTYLPGVPTMFISLLNHPDIRNCGLEYVRSFNSGAAPLPLEVLAKFERLSGGILREGYGLTEATCSCTSSPMLGPRKPGSIGVPSPGTEFRLVDLETGENDVPAGEEGEVCVRGPQVMKGYWNQPEETARAIRDGWLYTGDIARMDEDGYFYIVQRKKDMINVGGFKVFPNEVEEVLFTHPAVVEAAAIGIPHSYRGEVVKAFVVLKPGANASAEALIEHCRDKLAKFKLPAEVEFVESLPKSAVGKVLRRELRTRSQPEALVYNESYDPGAPGQRLG
jgi:long-chain acyl-CoA synthetase